MAILVMSLTTCLVSAEERVVWAEVVSVEPATRTVTVKPDEAACKQSKPPEADGLNALLAWDLEPACARTRTTEADGYEVTYRWAGREFTDRRAEHPGERIALRVQFDVQPSLSVR